MKKREKKIESVVFLVPRFYPLIGGIAIKVKELAIQIQKMGVEVTIITRKTRPELKRHEIVKGLEVYRIGPTGEFGWSERIRNFNLLIKLLLFRLFFKKKRPNIIHASAMGNNLIWLANLWGMVSRIPVVANPGGAGVINQALKGKVGTKFDLKKLPGLFTLWRYLMARSDLFTPVAKEVEQELLRAGIPKKRISTIPNGVDTSRFHPVNPAQKRRLRKKLGLPINKTIAIFCGRLSKEKGGLFLLKTWKRLANRETSLLILGKGKGHPLSIEKEMRKIAQTIPADQRPIFAGLVMKPERYYQAADLFLLPSESEGLSLSLLEAMACGLPPISTKVSGSIEVIKDGQNGFLIDYQDIEGLESKIKKLVENPKLGKRMGQRALATIREKYTAEIMARENLKIALKQDYPNFEVIVVDDGSTDNSREVVKRFKDRVKYIYQENRGVAAARNTGIKNSSGQYLLFLDSDDLIKKNHLAKLLKKERNSASNKIIFFSDLEFLINDKKTTQKIRGFKGLQAGKNQEQHLVKNYLGAIHRILFPRLLFQKGAIFDSSLVGAEDHDLIIQAILAGFSLKPNHQKTAIYRIRKNSRSTVSQAKIRVARAHLQIAKKYLSSKLAPQLKEIFRKKLQFSYFLLAKTLFQENKRKEAHRFFLKAKNIKIPASGKLKTALLLEKHLPWLLKIYWSLK